jgi:transmembrane sensor
MDYQRLLFLLTLYTQNTISESDFEELTQYIHQPRHDEILMQAIEEIGGNIQLDLSSAEDKERIFKQITGHPQFAPAKILPTRVLSARFNKWMAVAAALLITLGASYYLLKPRVNIKQYHANTKPAAPKIDMGTNKAILTLANGTKITLDKNKMGTIAHQGNFNLNQKTGYLKYDSAKNSRAEINAYNTITVPRGSTYQLLLGDGTQVWLNANSSITYPVAFNGATRRVSITGEAYFEVAHNAAKPFIVKSQLADVTVLGTHFNIQAYTDSKMVATLLSGSVKVSNQQGYTLIKPDQEASIAKDKANIVVKDVDADDAIAWKNGYFLFKNENIKNVMQVIARWYDVDVEYKGDMTGKTFGGTIARYQDIDKLLKAIELTGVIRFKVEGRRIIVMS